MKITFLCRCFPQAIKGMFSHVWCAGFGVMRFNQQFLSFLMHFSKACSQFVKRQKKTGKLRGKKLTGYTNSRTEVKDLTESGRTWTRPLQVTVD